jgi:AcrR family transcriptional regulator
MAHTNCRPARAPDGEGRARAQRGPRRIRRSIGASRSPDTHRAILSAAAAILAESGYAGFSMDALARRAHSSKPTLYRWWANKAALIMEVYEEANEAALAETDTGSLRADLIARVTTLWTWWDESWSGEALRSIIAEAQLDPTTQHEVRIGFLPRREAFLRSVFERAIARGELRNATGVDAAVTHLVGVSWLYLLTGRVREQEAIEPHVVAAMAGLDHSSLTA